VGEEELEFLGVGYAVAAVVDEMGYACAYPAVT
jgi:hypothetical protein